MPINYIGLTLGKFSYCVGFTGSENEVVEKILLKHHPHPVNIISSITPALIALRLPSTIGFSLSLYILETDFDIFLVTNSVSPDLALMVEKDTAGHVKFVSVSLCSYCPDTCEL